MRLFRFFWFPIIFLVLSANLAFAQNTYMQSQKSMYAILLELGTKYQQDLFCNQPLEIPKEINLKSLRTKFKKNIKQKPKTAKLSKTSKGLKGIKGLRKFKIGKISATITAVSIIADNYFGFSQKAMEGFSRSVLSTIVPIETIGKFFPCWDKATELKKDNRIYCRNVSEGFRKMESDMQNFAPLPPEYARDKIIGYANMPKGLNFGGRNKCFLKSSNSFNVTTGKKERIVYPPSSAKGYIARTFLYMEKEYKKYGFKLSPEKRKMFMEWHKKFKPTEKEIAIRKQIANTAGTTSSIAIYELIGT